MTSATRAFVRAVLVCVLLVVRSQVVHAQSVEAETLFREAKRLMKQGETAAACEKFSASLRLEPTVGTELNLADCREKNGQLATAWALFVKAASEAKRIGNDRKREVEARRRADDLENRLVYLTVSVSEEARVDGLVITSNDQPLDPALWNQRVPVDPDKYVLVAEAPGHDKWTATVTVETKSKRIEVPPLITSTTTENPKASVAPLARHDVASATARSEPGLTRPRKAAIAFTVFGVAAIGLGVGLGLHANHVEAQADGMCNVAGCSDPLPVDLNHTARTYALLANCSYAVGGVALIGGVVSWLLGAPTVSDHQISFVPIVSSGRTVFALGTRF
jgi:hypothetical protein